MAPQSFFVQSHLEAKISIAHQTSRKVNCNAGVPARSASMTTGNRWEACMPPCDFVCDLCIQRAMVEWKKADPENFAAESSAGGGKRGREVDIYIERERERVIDIAIDIDIDSYSYRYR